MQSVWFGDLITSRRRALRSLVGGAALAAVGAAAPRRAEARKPARRVALDFTSPADNLYAFGKIWGGYERPMIGGYHGLMYARIPGKRLVPLFNYVGAGVIFCEFDPKGALRIKSRETAFFTDLRTGEVLETWKNPFTDESVEVYHFYNPMVSGRLGTQIPRFAFGDKNDTPTLMNEGTVFPNEKGEYPFTLPFSQFGDDVMLQWDYAHDMTNPVTEAGWPSYSTGARITPSEHFTLYCSRAELEDRSLPTVRMRGSFARLCDCWPWMKMGRHRDLGITLFARMHSHKGLPGTGDVPPKVLAYLEKHAPEYLTLPDTWESNNKRVETWGAFAMDVPPESSGYEWSAKALRPDSRPPTGLGARFY